MPLSHATALKMGHQVPTKHGTYPPKYVALHPQKTAIFIFSASKIHISLSLLALSIKMQIICFTKSLIPRN
jgi:hypothetical protein